MAKKKTDSSAPNRYWFASTSAVQGREQTLSVLRKASKDIARDIHVLEVPQNLKFGSFDDLIRLLDDITKQETSLDSVMKRVQRQALDLNPEVELNVTWSRQTMSVGDYIQRFKWDEARYSKSRNVVEILDTIIRQVQRLDEDLKAKVISYNETKQSYASLQKKEDASLMQRDMVDIFGTVVDTKQIVDTANLMTLPVIVPKIQQEIFLATYATTEGVVPTSAHMHEGATDKDGNMLYTVVIMRRNKDACMQAYRKLKCTAKEYHHQTGAYDERNEKRAALVAEREKQEQYLSRICVASFSDIFMAIVHLKALKIFVDSVLRLGVPVNFCAYTVVPTAVTKQQTKLWSEMSKVLAAGDADQYHEDNYNPFAFADLVPFVN